MPDRRPLLSVVISTYNRAGMLDRCLESTHTISIEDCEIVVIDDVSTDNTLDVVARHQRLDPRIRLMVNERNFGAMASENIAIYAARGKYLARLGDDDVVLADYSPHIAILERFPHIGFVYSYWRTIDEHGNLSDPIRWPGLADYPYIGSRNEFLDLLQANYIKGQAVVSRTQLRDVLGGVDEGPAISLANDWDMWLKYCHYRPTAFINTALAGIGVHAHSNTETLRSTGSMAQGRLNVWHKWLVDNDYAPVLDDYRWQHLYQAFIADLRYSFGEDTARINYYLKQLEQLRQDHVAKLQRRFDTTS